MVLLLPVLNVFAATGIADLPVVVRGSSWGRAQHRGALGVEVGAIVHRRSWLDVVVAGRLTTASFWTFQAGRMRNHWGLGLIGEPLWVVSPWLAVGPSLALEARNFRQQFSAIQSVFTPSFGGRVRVTALRHPRWYAGVDARVLVDLITTHLVLDSAAIFALPPLGFGVGLYLVFGREERS